MITDIRDYFRGVVNTVDSDLKEHKSPVISSNIADTILEDTYFINIGSTQVERLDTATENTTSVLVEIYANGYNNELENYDNAYCKALDVLTTAIDQSTISQSNMIKAVDATTVDVETILDNDNAFKFSIQFTVKTYF